MKTLVLSLLLLGSFSLSTSAQTGPHKPSGPVTHVFFSSVENKFLTIGIAYGVNNVLSYDVALWDGASQKPLWIKPLSDLGYPQGSMNNSLFRASPDLSLLWVGRPGTGNYYLINFATGQTSMTTHVHPFFTSDNQMLTKVDGKKKEVVLVHPVSQAQVKLAGDVVSFCTNRKGDKIFINEKGKVKIYDVATRAWDKKPIGTYEQFGIGNWPVQFGSRYLAGRNTIVDINEHVSFTVGPYIQSAMVPVGDMFAYLDDRAMTVTTYDKASKVITTFNLAQTKAYDIYPMIWNADDAAPRIDVLERSSHYESGTLIHFSYLNSYDVVSGKLVRSIELNSASAESLAANAKLQEQRSAAEAAERAAYNSPERVLQRRLAVFEGKYIFHKETKGIYYVVPDVGLYQGNTVKLMEQHDDKKKIIDVYEPLDNIETNFTVISRPVTCSACKGRGMFSQSYTSTVADLEYTTGKKLEKTTTTTGTCGTCGGCGLVPNN